MQFVISFYFFVQCKIFLNLLTDNPTSILLVLKGKTMGKSFNDDELQDIMNEIESLESSSESVDTPSQEPEAVMAQEEPAPQMLSEEEQEIEDSFNDEPAEPVQELHPQKVHHNEAPMSKTSMNFSVEGNTTLDLSFLAGDKTVHCVVTHDSFEVELEGGLKFTLPLTDWHQKKSA